MIHGMVISITLNKDAFVIIWKFQWTHDRRYIHGTWKRKELRIPKPDNQSHYTFFKYVVKNKKSTKNLSKSTA
jgi:hypothetical protein